jgi:hypothetical protein
MDRRRYRLPQPIKAIDLQELGATTVIYGEIDDPAMRHINPSLAWDRDKLKISIRSCNFKVERKGAWSFRDGSAYSKTDVVYGDVDPDTLEVTNLKKLTLSPDSPTRTLVCGLEDVRLFPRKDGMHVLGFESDRLARHLHNESTSMAEYLIKGDKLQYIKTYEKPDRKLVEKNWSPTDTPTEKFDFTYSDSQVYKDGKLIGSPTHSQIHGGSQLLKQKDGTWLSLVHEKKLDVSLGHQSRLTSVYDKYIYYTYLARHGADGIITHLSEPFRFGTLENIEFAAGMVEYKDYLIMSLGIRDCKYAVVKIEKDKLVNLLRSK